ncbi:MAG: alanine--tRNA ligase [Bacteroidia bacterium]|nr:alanine--tRNA ligase [Bacteroidia bacterium]
MSKSSQIRKQFLDFFESKGHTIVPSAPIVVKNDPTLMFTNAGMNQFKDWFLGNEEPKYKRVADTQKCLRVSGKHNDLEEVGVDTYHHTMFEMLGNWSFGDYFKKEAIEWAWELLTEVYKLPKDRLYVTVFEGDSKEGLAFDQEAYDNWKLWISPDRILNGNKKDNFWEMGDTGPCGPCSEIHIDLRSDAERAVVSGADLVNNDHPQVIEIWNNVFMEFNRKADGSLEKLPAQHVDTGMGFERLCRAIEAKQSNYDTDVFMPYLKFIEQQTGVTFGMAEPTDIAMRVLADHVRTITFAVLDGQLPSNTGAGYVIRRILRRAVRYYYSFLNTQQPLLYKMVSLVGDSFADIFPEVKDKKQFIEQVVKEEELGFLRTLENGIKRLEKIEGDINGEEAFELFDTYGFPIDLTQLIAREKGFKVDLEGFEKNLQLQKERSRKATSLETDDWVVLEENDQIKFIGYDTLEADVKIMRYRKVKSKGKEQFQLVFNQTPFYAESGGQVGDTGIIESANEKISILDTQKENNLIIHIVAQLPENPQANFVAWVDVGKRKLTQANHSATHLLHAALRSVLGTHVEQKGSLVNSEYLRFDFSHFKGMTEEEWQAVEQMVNQKIRENISLDEKRNVPIAAAKEMGAMALFGEKYGDNVRVITFDSAYSVELCGGTHVASTGEIGIFKIKSEAAVAAGVRRIEAITSVAAEQIIAQQEKVLQNIKSILKSNDLVKSIETLLQEKQELQRKLESFENEKTAQLKSQLLEKVLAHTGLNALFAKVNIANAEQLKNLSFQLKQEVPNLFCLLVMENNQKPFISLIMSEELVASKQWHAGNLVKTWAKHIQGGGGGQAFYATAGGNNLAGLDVVLKEAEIWLEGNM